MQADDDQIHPGRPGRSPGKYGIRPLLVSENGTGRVKGGVAMYSGKHEILLTTIINQVADLDPAELVQLADYIRGLKLARNLRK